VEVDYHLLSVDDDDMIIIVEVSPVGVAHICTWFEAYSL
jgi:hypothetical protein